MIKIKCAICGKEIVNPILSQKTCSRECSRAYKKAYCFYKILNIQLTKEEYEKKMKEME